MSCVVPQNIEQKHMTFLDSHWTKDLHNCRFNESEVVTLSKKRKDYIAVCCMVNNNACNRKHALCRSCQDDELNKAGRRPRKSNPKVGKECCHDVHDLLLDFEPWWCQKEQTGQWSFPAKRLVKPLGCVKCVKMFVWDK